MKKIYEKDIKSIKVDDTRVVVTNNNGFETDIPSMIDGNISVVHEILKLTDKNSIKWAELKIKIIDYDKNLTTTGIARVIGANELIEQCQFWYYDNSFGTQHLFGVIVINDGIWLNREEYDGSEWWKLNIQPKTPKWANTQD